TRSATHEVTWTDATHPDAITARSEGPSCAQAAVLFVARAANGDPLWTFATTYYDMTSGGVPPEGAPNVTPEAMDEFLARWADVTTARSGTLPAWSAGASGPVSTSEAFEYSTPFEREDYEALRGRDLPMICYAAAVEATQCLVVDPSSRAPTMIV